MTIPFQNIPQGWRLPLFFAELDPSEANLATQVQRTLIVGQRTTGSGTGSVDQPEICASHNVSVSKFGASSMLTRMYDKYRMNDAAAEVWTLCLADDPGAVAAVYTFVFNTPATANGTLYLYITGRLVALPVASTQSAGQLATAAAAAINTVPDMPVTATASGGTVTLTADNAGASANGFDIEVNYRGAPGGEYTPAGLTYTITQTVTGTTNPSLTVALANCMDIPFDFIVFPYTDTASLNAMQAFLNDTTGRWSYQRQVYGHMLTALSGTLGALTTAGAARNDQHATIMGFKGTSPTPNDEWAAAVYGAAAPSLRNDPGRPVQSLAVLGVLPPGPAGRFAQTDRNALLHSGISTFTVDSTGTVHIENLITTYQVNAYSVPDTSYLEIEPMFLLMFLLRDSKTLVTSKYGRMKLAQDGTRFAPGSAIVTPSTVRLDLVARYKQLEYEGYVQNTAAFKAGIIVEINQQNPNRLDCLVPWVLIGQLRMFALLGQFRYQ